MTNAHLKFQTYNHVVFANEPLPHDLVSITVKESSTNRQLIHSTTFTCQSRSSKFTNMDLRLQRRFLFRSRELKSEKGENKKVHTKTDR